MDDNTTSTTTSTPQTTADNDTIFDKEAELRWGEDGGQNVDYDPLKWGRSS